ncbi:MAG: NAD(P)-binding domain-containing protein, partial [Terracidiphilus sp.]
MIPSATYFHSFPTTEDEPHPSSLRELKAKVAAQLHARIENEIHPRKRPPTAKMKKHSAANRTASRPGYDELKKRIQQRQARVGIIGLGYVGLPLALLFSEQKFSVTGFDIDQRKVDTLARGESYIYRITAEEIRKAKKQGFLATSEYTRIAEMDAVIICVPTPLNQYHEPDLSFITDTTHAIAPHLQAGQLVVLESTTYPGTT